VTLPGPGPRHADALRENEGCVVCHADVALEWSASRHRSAYTNPAFSRAISAEPLAECRACHAPEADPALAPEAGLADLGVGCVSCHGTAERVLAGPGDATAPHALVRSEAFAGPRACAGCHEFTFPGGDALAQSTVTEHASGPHAGTSCADCHMPRGDGGRRRHDFASVRDETTLREALSVFASRDREGVRVELVSVGVGHSFPTGDLFRRLRVRAEVPGPDGSVLADDERFLGRAFDERAPVKREIADDRVGPAGLLVRLAPGAAPTDPIEIEVRLERVLFGISHAPSLSEIESSVVLFEETLAPLEAP